jgi:hypothetical protein
MSHRTTLPHSDSSQTEQEPSATSESEPKKSKLELSVSQVVGGALAAMTAAALGSTLGVAGTITGAALASIVAGVAGALYTASLRTGREKVMTAFSGRTVPPRAGSTALPPPPPPMDPRNRRGPFPFKRALGVTLAVFALAAVLVSGYEAIAGHALSGGSGTTVSQVERGSSAATVTPSKPTPSTQSQGASASPTASPSGSPTPAQQSAEPSAPGGTAATPSSTPTQPTTPALAPGRAVTPAG